MILSKGGSAPCFRPKINENNIKFFAFAKIFLAKTTPKAHNRLDMLLGD